jgi:hypothetical protein
MYDLYNLSLEVKTNKYNAGFRVLRSNEFKLLPSVAFTIFVMISLPAISITFNEYSSLFPE